MSRGGLCQAMDRIASKAEPTYEALIEEVRRSPSVTPDETGWRVGGKLWWMWAFSTFQVTLVVYRTRVSAKEQNSASRSARV